MGRETPDTILVMHLAGIGDLLMGAPALASLRVGFPDSAILLLTWRKSRDVARLLTTVDECDGLEEGSSWRAVRHNVSTLWRLRQRRVDLAINLYQLYRWVGVAKLAGLLRLVRPARTAGRDTDCKGTLFDVRIPERSSEILHEVARQRRVVEQLGCPPVNSAIPLRIDDADQQMVDAWLTARGVAPNDALIGLHPGAMRRCHRWPVESFASVAKALMNAQARRVVLIGSRDERRLAERIARQLDRPLVAAGELSLGQLACLMRRLRLLIANDSGPMHLAATLDVPLVALMGPTDPQRYGPYPLDRVNQHVLYTEGCAPCYRTSCRGHDSFEGLAPGVVLEAAEAVLRGRRPGGLIRIRPRARVLHVHTLPLVSGSGLNTCLSMQGQRDVGFAVALACAPAEEDAAGDLAALVGRMGMRVHVIRHLRRAIHPWHDLWAVIELWRLCRWARYTIVHTHNSKAGIVGRVAAWLAGVPIIVHTYHSCVFRYGHLRPWQQQLFLWVERLAAPLTTHFIVISDALRQEFLGVGIAPSDRIETIYSGIDLEAFHGSMAHDGHRQTLGLAPEDVVIGSVARLDVGKGHEELLVAFAQLTSRFPHAKLLCVGDGPLRRRVEARIRQLGLTDCVQLLGQRDDVPQLTQAFDIAVLASHYEGMGRVLLEAQAAGKPVVAMNAGGMVDIVKDGQTGYLVPVGDARAFAEALGRLIADAALRARMGQAAVEWVSSRFSRQRMCEQLNALYDRLLRSRERW